MITKNLPMISSNEQLIISALTNDNTMSGLVLQQALNPTITFDCNSILCFVEKYKGYLSKQLINDFDKLVDQFIYIVDKNTFMQNVKVDYINQNIPKDLSNEIWLNLNSILEESRDHFFLEKELELSTIKAHSTSKDHYQNRLKEYFTSKSINFIKYIENYKNEKHIEDTRYEVIYLKYSFLPKNIQKYMGQIIIDKDITIEKLIPEYRKMRKKPFSDKSINVKLKNTVIEKSDRVLDLYNKGYSYSKIQDILTKECIQEELIPSTVKRYSRKKNSNKTIETVPTLLPLSVIKDVIGKDNYNFIEAEISE